MSGNYFYASASLSGRSNNLQITESSIIGSNIDMNFNTITSVKDPEQAQDAATKLYVDAMIAKMSRQKQPSNEYVILLQKNDYSQITNRKPGSYIISISPETVGAPSAVFSVSKSTDSSIAHVQRITAVPGTSKEMLELNWPGNSQILLRKTGKDTNSEFIMKIM